MNKRQQIGIFGVPAAVIIVVIMLVVPLPSFLIDILITLNMGAALMILLTTMYVRKAKDFSAFPSLLLLATVFRLAINISVTRLVLLHGFAGSVVQSFGNFVVGGQIVVGLVIFLILIIIQFVVITSGAGRVSEVSARFSLDAMGPKLIAIDGELNQGLIDQNEARVRRREIDATAEFYGNMDGASKFVRGDAVAATVITVINLLGGFAIGVIGHHLSVSSAIHTYSILSVGDGLVSQIPALLLSLSTGIIVTRGAVEDDVTDFGSDVVRQIRNQPRAIQIAGISLIIMGLMPGLPHIPFMFVGIGLMAIASRIRRTVAADALALSVEEGIETPAEDLESPQAIMRSVRSERLELKISPNLAPLLMVDRGGDLEDRLKALRRDIAARKGFVIPTVRTTDDSNLPPNTYRVMVNNIEVARGNAYVGQELVIGPGLERIQGTATTEPAFGLPAKWIPVEARERAIAQVGVTPFPATSVIITHLAEVVSAHAAELLSTQQVQQMVDALKASDPALVEEMKPSQLSLMELQRVLASLLADNIPILDFVRITEAVTSRCRLAGKTQEALVEAARTAVGAAITAAHTREDRLAVVTIDAFTEQVLATNLRVTDTGTVLSVDAIMTEHLVSEMRDAADRATRDGKEAVLLVSPPLRPALAHIFAAALPRLAVLSISEITRGVRLERVGVIGGVGATADL